MTPAIGIWLGLVLSSTVAAVVALVLFVQVLRHDRDLRWPRRLGAALVAPWGALESVRHGRYVAASIFAVAVVTYGGLQLMAHTLG